jgi:GT2 family glycosyltransferase
MIKYSFIMPYFQRAAQFYNTLASLKHHYATRNDWDITVIEDSKNSDDLHSVVQLFNDDIPIKVVRTGRDDLYNPSPAFNVGVDQAEGEYIILTNPEGMHMNDVLAVFDEALADQPDAYVIAACESGRNCKGVFDPERPKAFAYDHHMWYQHGQHNNRCYHFCTAIRRETYLRIGGFDERYADGYCFDDDAFRDRVKWAGIPFVVRDDALTLHQEHDKGSLSKSVIRKLWDKNHALYEADKLRHKELTSEPTT